MVHGSRFMVRDRRKARVFAHFLDIEIGSIDETKNHLGEALEAMYITATEHAELVELAERAKRASQGLRAYLERCGENFPLKETPRGRSPARSDRPNTPNKRTSHPRTGNSRDDNQNREDSEPGTSSLGRRPPNRR